MDSESSPTAPRPTGRGPASAAHVPVSPWVLLQVDGSPDYGWVVAEGTHPRRHTRLARTRIASSATVAAHLPRVIAAAITTAQPQVGTAYLPSGSPMRLIAVPVLGPADTVAAVQLWAGPRARPAPPRPSVGALRWTDSSHGIALTTQMSEHLLDTGNDTAGPRSLPALVQHLDHVEDRLGLLRLLDPADPAQPQRWAAIATTRARTGGAPRTLFLAATRTMSSPGTVSAVLIDISATHPPAPASITNALLAAMPVHRNHAIGVIDLPTGIVHEWIHPGPDLLRRWLHEIPDTHPDDIVTLARTRARLTAGIDHLSTRWRLRFDPDSDWRTVAATWTVLTRHPAPQAMLDLRLVGPATPPLAEAPTEPDLAQRQR